MEVFIHSTVHTAVRRTIAALRNSPNVKTDALLVQSSQHADLCLVRPRVALLQHPRRQVSVITVHFTMYHYGRYGL
eukprot:SAG31_NODE_4804_length_2947_cov_1.739466_2_plen_76_part_00